MQTRYEPWHTNDVNAYNTNTISCFYYIRHRKKLQHKEYSTKKTPRKPWHDNIVNAYTIEYWTCFFYIRQKKQFNHPDLSTEKFRLWITFLCDTKKSNALGTTFLWKLKSILAMKTFTLNFFKILFFKNKRQFLNVILTAFTATFFLKNK